METKFCTITRHDEKLYKEMLKKEGWHLNPFRRFYRTFCLLAVVVLTGARACYLYQTAEIPLTAAAKGFFAIGGAACIVAFVLEWKNTYKREERTLGLKAGKRMSQSGKAGEKEEIHWYEDFCVIETEEISSRYEYTGLRKYEEGENYIFVTFGGDVTVPVDKAGFRQGKAEKFKKFLEGKKQASKLDK